MENFEARKIIEKTPEPKDISSEFLNMSVEEFDRFLRTQRKEPALSIKVDWEDVWRARRLKAFLEDFDASPGHQKRSAAIRATEDQYKQALNAFASGVKWEKIE